MNRIRKLAVAVVALAGLSGCATTQVSTKQVAGGDAVQAQGSEQKVSRPLTSYGSMGGYRYRRLAAFTAG